MKRIAATFAALALTTGAALADPALGTWASRVNEEGRSLHVKIVQCGANICGTISKVLGTDDQSNVGKTMIWDMSPGGNGSYSGGKVWAADTDKTYKGKMKVSGNTLKISGCVLGGAVCRGEEFSRVN